MPDNPLGKEAQQLWADYTTQDDNELFWKQYYGLIKKSGKLRQIPVAPTEPQQNNHLPFPSFLQVPSHRQQTYAKSLSSKKIAVVLLWGILLLFIPFFGKYGGAIGTNLFWFILFSCFSVLAVGKGRKRHTRIDIDTHTLTRTGKKLKTVTIQLEDITEVVSDHKGLTIAYNEGGVQLLEVTNMITNYDDLKAYLKKVALQNFKRKQQQQVAMAVAQKKSQQTTPAHSSNNSNLPLLSFLQVPPSYQKAYLARRNNQKIAGVVASALATLPILFFSNNGETGGVFLLTFAVLAILSIAGGSNKNNIYTCLELYNNTLIRTGKNLQMITIDLKKVMGTGRKNRKLIVYYRDKHGHSQLIEVPECIAYCLELEQHLNVVASQNKLLKKQP